MDLSRQHGVNCTATVLNLTEVTESCLSHKCYVIRPFHAVITFSHALVYFYFARGLCRVPFRRMNPASIDGLSLLMCRLS